MEKLGLKVGYSKTVNLGNYENEKFEFSVEFSADADRETYPAIMLEEIVKLRLLCKGKIAGKKQTEDRTTAKEGRETPAKAADVVPLTDTEAVVENEALLSRKAEEAVSQDEVKAAKKAARKVQLSEAKELGIKNYKQMSFTNLGVKIDKVKAKAAEVVEIVEEKIPEKKEAPVEEAKEEKTEAITVDTVRTEMGEHVASGRLTPVQAKAVVKSYGMAQKLNDVKPKNLQRILDGALELIAKKELDI